jgi:cytochrome c oxidase subunit I+III
VLLGGAVFPLFGAVYYWFPKFTGRMLGETLGRWHFWLFFIGFNVAFFPMHLLGLHGMPRRVWSYPAGLGWDAMNATASVGAFVIALGMAVFLVNVALSWRRGVRAASDPWGAGTLEWSVPSPPPPHNFDAMPVVHGREPLWTPARQPSHVSGLAADAREVLVTSALAATPESRPLFPQPTAWPFVSALATTALFIGSVYSPWAVVWGAIPVTAAVIGWFWPGRQETAQALALEKRP